MTSFAPVFYSFGVLAVFSLGALFGAAISEGEQKRRERRSDLMQAVDS